MEHGDLGTWVDHGVLVVLEGVLAQIPPPETEGWFRKRLIWTTPDHWGWSRHAMKVINDKAYRLSLPMEVITFTDPWVAEEATEWLDKYSVAVAGCQHYVFDYFCESLTWRPNVQAIVDSDPNRIHRYGQRGYQTVWGGEF
jgi:hypothetical protein